MEVQLNNGVMMPSPGFGTGAIHGWVPIPKSENSGRTQKNIDLEGFALSEAEMTRIDALDTGHRFNVDPEAAIEANMQVAVPE